MPRKYFIADPFSASDFNTAFGDLWPDNLFMTSTRNWTTPTTTTIVSVPTTTTTLETTTITTTTTMSMLDVDQLCGNGSRADGLVQDYRFWLSGVAVSVVGLFGLFGNLISLVTIATMMKKSLFNKLLLTLTIFDTLFIFNGGIFMAQQSLEFKNEVYNFLFPCVIYPLAGFSMTGRTKLIYLLIIRKNSSYDWILVKKQNAVYN
jgi:hypothetical protein